MPGFWKSSAIPSNACLVNAVPVVDVAIVVVASCRWPPKTQYVARQRLGGRRWRRTRDAVERRHVQGALVPRSTRVRSDDGGRGVCIDDGCAKGGALDARHAVATRLAAC